MCQIRETAEKPLLRCEQKIYLIIAMAPDSVKMAALRVVSINIIENTATITLTLSFKPPVKYSYQKCCTSSSVITSEAETEVTLGNQ